MRINIIITIYVIVIIAFNNSDQVSGTYRKEYRAQGSGQTFFSKARSRHPLLISTRKDEYQWSKIKDEGNVLENKECLDCSGTESSCCPGSSFSHRGAEVIFVANNQVLDNHLLLMLRILLITVANNEGFGFWIIIYC